MCHWNLCITLHENLFGKETLQNESSGYVFERELRSGQKRRSFKGNLISISKCMTTGGKKIQPASSKQFKQFKSHMVSSDFLAFFFLPFLAYCIVNVSSLRLFLAFLFTYIYIFLYRTLHISAPILIRKLIIIITINDFLSIGTFSSLLYSPNTKP